MGLDQYLYAQQRHAYGTPKHEAVRKALSKTHHQNLVDEDYGYSCYVSGWNIGTMVPEEAYASLVAITGMIPESQSPHFDVQMDGDAYLVQACCAYWRKANQIHAWFVEHCQDGVDDCQLSPPIHGEVLSDLIDRCKKVLETPLLAASLLPSQSGFFFGSVDYDEWYIADLKYTVDRLTEVADTYPKPMVLRYRSSW